MKHTTLVAIVATLLLAGCATRNQPCESIAAAGDQMRQTGPEQSNANTDFTPTVQVGDTGAALANAPTNSSVEVQTNNNAMAPQLQVHDLFGSAALAKNILTSTTPAEASVIRSLEWKEQRAKNLSLQMDSCRAPEDRAMIAGHLEKLEREISTLREELKTFATAKVDQLRELSPGLDLSSLESIVAMVVDNDHVGTDREMTDAQAQAVRDAVVASFARPVPVPQPTLNPDDGE